MTWPLWVLWLSGPATSKTTAEIASRINDSLTQNLSHGAIGPQRDVILVIHVARYWPFTTATPSSSGCLDRVLLKWLVGADDASREAGRGWLMCQRSANSPGHDTHDHLRPSRSTTFVRTKVSGLDRQQFAYLKVFCCNPVWAMMANVFRRGSWLPSLTWSSVDAA